MNPLRGRRAVAPHATSKSRASWGTHRDRGGRHRKTWEAASRQPPTTMVRRRRVGVGAAEDVGVAEEAAGRRRVGAVLIGCRCRDGGAVHQRLPVGIDRVAVAGDPVALASFEAVGAWLGHGLADLAAILDPRVFIIGEGVTEAGELLVGPARATFEEQLTARGHRPTDLRPRAPAHLQPGGVRPLPRRLPPVLPRPLPHPGRRGTAQRRAARAAPLPRLPGAAAHRSHRGPL